MELSSIRKTIPHALNLSSLRSRAEIMVMRLWNLLNLSKIYINILLRVYSKGFICYLRDKSYMGPEGGI